MKKMVIVLFTLSICLASGNIKKQMDDLMRSLQYKYQISGPEDLYKLKTQQTPRHGRTASRDMGDLVGDWRVEEDNMEVFVTVGSDQSIPDIMTLMAMVEAEGSITATASDYVAELTYLLDSSIMEGGDGGGDCDISCEEQYNAYNDYGFEPEDIYCECCHEDWPLDDICEDDDYDNILPNGDFEDVYEAGNGWQFYATDWIWYPTYAVNHHVELTGNYIYGSYIPFEAFDGDYSLKLWGQFSGAENQTAYYQTFTDLEPGTEIHAEAMLMSHQDHWIGNGSNTVTVFASYWDAGWGFIGRDDSEVFSGADEYNMWHERGVDAVVPEGVSYVNIGLEFSQIDDSQGGSVYIDNMNVHIYDDDGDREDNSRNYDALTFAQDYVNDNSSDWGENAFDLESEFNLVVDGDYVSGGLGGDDPENCEINWPEDPYKMAVYSFVSEYVLVEGGSVGCFLDDGDLDQTYADFVMGMENEWAGGGDDDDDDDDGGPDLLIMNMDLMEFFMVSFGMDLDSLDIENPTVIGFGSSSDDENMVMGLMFDETGVIELMADSEEAAAATSLDETSITFTNLSLYDSTGAAVLTVTGTIGPGWIDLEAGVETPIDFFNEDGEGDDDMEFYVSFSEDSTGMDIEVGYDDYYGEEYSDTSYFDWSATTDSLFLYFEIDDDYYYEDEADTMALGYMIIEDTLFASSSFNPCEDDEYESYEECFGDMDIPGFDELVDVESFRINQETVFTSTVLTSIEPTNEGLPEEFKLYAAYPNPFNPMTTIRFDVGSTSHESTLRIYDVSGRNVATLINGQLQPGSYEVQWDARGFASGIYFSELISGTKRHTQKMVLLK